MKYINKQLGELLFDRVEETVINDALTPNEKIPKYRAILDDLFKALTADSVQYLSTLKARSVFIYREYKPPRNISFCADRVRLVANKVVHESGFQPSALDDKRCVYQLAQVLSCFSKLAVPLAVESYYKDSLDEIMKEVPVIRPQRPVYDFFAVIEDIFLPYGDLEGKFCVLTCNTDELGVIRLKLSNKKNENGFGSDLSIFGKIVSKYQNIYVTHVKKSDKKEDEFFADEKSLIVLEPDYLVDAKELSECRQLKLSAGGNYADNPLLFILNRFTRGGITDRIMIGNIVGRMLDDMVTDKEYSFKKSFEAVMRENAFGMLCIANENGTYDRQKIEATYLEAASHEKQLKATLEKLKEKQITLEPTFISAMYGLQGRLDLLIEDRQDKNHKQIIELKSSKNYPSLGLAMYPSHEAQTMIYDLLLSSTFPERIGDNSILYSSAPSEEKPLRNVNLSEKYLAKQDLLMTRNRIVAGELNLAMGNYEPFDEIFSESFGPYPKYMEELLQDFNSVLSGLDETLRLYFRGFLKFIYSELQVAKIGSSDAYSKSNGYADLWKASTGDKIENYDVLIYLCIKEVKDDFHIFLEPDRERPLFSINVTNVTSFRAGDTAILYPTPNPDEIHPLKSQILKCYVVSVNAEQIEVSLVNKQVDKNYFKTSPHWALDRDFRETGYKQLLNLLFEFTKSDRRVIDLVLGLKKPEFTGEINVPENGLDAVQLENVKNALRAKDYYLIQGPPGTGKTSRVLVEIVRNITKTDSDVMVVAYTNRAVDEICNKLTDLKIDCIRLGKSDKTYSWSHISGRLRLDELNEEVGKKRVFVSTISTFANSLDILKFKKFDTLIVDEASQVLEPQVIGFLKHFRRWIFIGDENQLPSVVLQSVEDSKCSEKVLNDLSLLNFRESLFYRLKKNAVKNAWSESYGALRYQYRMHADIAKFPREEFYGNALEESNESQRMKIPDYNVSGNNPVSSLLTKARVVFVPSKADLRSKINEEEAILVAETLKHIARVFGDNFDPGKTVGVITPFRAQIANIRNKLPVALQNISIDTVERFQGSERKIIIVSFAVKSSVQLGAIQSKNDEGVDRKLNVAITRAIDHLILIGSEDVLVNDPVFKKLIETIKANHGYILNPLKTKSLPTDLF